MSRRWIILLFCLSFPLFLLPHSAASGGLRVNESTTRILLGEGRVQLSLENSVGREIAARVHLELLDVGNEVRADALTDELIKPGTSRLDIPLSLPPPTPGIAGPGKVLWYRLRLRVSPSSPADSGVNTVDELIALSEITPDIFTLQIVAPEYAREGALCRLHVRAAHPITSRPVGGVSITGEIGFDDDDEDSDERQAAPRPLRATARTDAQGYVTLDFNLPRDLKDESGEIKIVGRLGNLVEEANDDINIDHSARILLSTDKPLYQPGQAAHVRALVFDHSRHAMPAKDATLKIMDEEGTTVFRAPLKTSRFGIASAEWTIPESTRLGNYTIRVELDEGEEDNSASQTIKVSRYDLPNFAVSVKPDRQYYLPGQSAEVEVRGDYLFGEPVTRGHVRVVREEERRWSYSEQRWITEEGEHVEGEIDSSGRFVAHIDLEDEQNALTKSNDYRYRDLTYAAYLTDPTTNRTEQRHFDLRVTKDAIHVYVSEANYHQAEGLPLEFYLSTFYADGTPARCEVAISEEAGATIAPAQTHHGPAAPRDPGAEKRGHLLQSVATNRFGVARVKGPVIARSADGERQVRFKFAARDRKGKTGHHQESFNVDLNAALRVETDKALYRAGDPIKARIISNKTDLTVIVDVARDLQVIRSEVVRLNGGEAVLTLPYSEDFKDRMTIAASSDDVPQFSNYYHNFITARRTVLYPRDRELKLDVQLGRDTYRPGEEATAELQINTPDGRSVEGALGVVVLDKAVEERARTNEESGAYGFYKNFHGFLYGTDELAGLTHRDLERMDLHHGVPEGVDLAAEVLLQRAHGGYGLSFSSGRGYLPQSQDVFNKLISTQLKPLATALQKHYVDTAEYPVDEPLLRRVLGKLGVNLDEARDPWGEPYRAAFSLDRALDVMSIMSVGPDKRVGTLDDFLASRMAWPYFSVTGEKINRVVADYHERTGAFIRDAATLKNELRRAGLEFDNLRDRWGHPYRLSFGISGMLYTVEVRSGGPDGSFNETKPSYSTDDFSVWTIWTSYFTETLTRIDAGLAAYAQATGRFPLNEAELREALRGSGAELDKLRDVWGGRYYVDYKTEVRPDYRAGVDNPPAQPQAQSGTRFRPNTQQISTIRFYSYGPDGKGGTYDDLTAASFTSASYDLRESKQIQSVTTERASLAGSKTGMISGGVLDPAGASVPGARVTIINQRGVELSTITNDAGLFEVSNLGAGYYTVRIEAPGFKIALAQRVEVLAGTTNIITVNLEIGQVGEVVQITDVAQIDQSSTAVGANVNDQLYANIPVQRSASSLFYLSGGINVRAVTGGFDPQYGRSNGGIIDVITKSDETGSANQQSPISTPRLREYFPETLLWQPALETDASGHARLNFQLADNITTWKMSVIGSTLDGEIGTAETEFRAFQPFFVEHDPPRVLTEGDEINLPVVLRNYMEKAQAVELEIKPESWFALLGPAQKRAEVAARDATRETFHFRAVASVDEGKQRITANGPEASDAIEKPVRVHPDGQEIAITDSHIFTETATLDVNIPGDAIAGSTRAELKIYPRLMGHVIESVEGILRRPYGCGEQTISSTYPSVMVLRAYKHNGGTPSSRARRYAQAGYERLLNYRAASGGFSYWGRDDADLALTAYALRFLNDARDVLAVDEKVVSEAREWLVKQQLEDGSWPAPYWSSRLNNADIALRASFIASVLAATDPGGSASNASPASPKPTASPDPLARAFAYLSPHVEATNEPYFVASYALAAMGTGRRTEAARAIDRLRALARTEGEMKYWTSDTNTPFHGWGLTGKIETTALAVQALARGRDEKLDGKDETPQGTRDARLIDRGLLFLVRAKDRYGVWHSTQATINVLNALISTSGAGVKGDAAGSTAEIIVNGRSAASIEMTQGEQLSSPLRVDISKFISHGNNRIEIRRAGNSATTQVTAQLVSTYWIPWPTSVNSGVTTLNHAASDTLHLTVAFDKREVKIGDEVTCKVNAGRVGPYGYGMMLAEIGLPPGADVDRASLERAMKDSGWNLNRYDILPDRLIVYLWPRGNAMSFEFKFRPRYGLAAQTAPSLLYDYYNPEARTVVAPAKFMVR